MNRDMKMIKKMFRASTPIRVINKVFSVLLIIEIALMVVFVGFLFAPTLFHFYPYNIITASMSPKIPVGSLVYVDQSLDNSLLQVNDVIAFREGDSQYIIVHRINEVKDGYYVTKGDANTETENVPFDKVIGKEVFNIPELGNVATVVMQYKYIFVAVALGTAALTFIFSFIKQHQESKKRQAWLLEHSEDETSEQSAMSEMSEMSEAVETINKKG